MLLEKPYELEECLAQAESLMALYVGLKPQKERCYTLVFGMDLVIDPDRRKVMLKGNLLNLTRKEFELLFCLARHAGKEWALFMLQTFVRHAKIA